MTLREDKGFSKTYDGVNGIAVLVRNFGNRDTTDKWQVSVEVNGEYKVLARRAEFTKAYALAEQAIG